MQAEAMTAAACARRAQWSSNGEVESLGATMAVKMAGSSCCRWNSTRSDGLASSAWTADMRVRSSGRLRVLALTLWYTKRER